MSTVAPVVKSRRTNWLAAGAPQLLCGPKPLTSTQATPRAPPKAIFVGSPPTVLFSTETVPPIRSSGTMLTDFSARCRRRQSGYRG